MWRAATSFHRHRRRLSSQINQSKHNIVMQLKCQSTVENQKESLEQIFESIEQQTLEEERKRAINKPTPWFSLLHYPSRAAWRASDHLLGNRVNKQKDDDEVDNKSGKSPLQQTQFNLLKHSERTNKQLRRTYKRISDTQKQLAIKRERERRMAANLAVPPQKIEQAPDGYIEDEKGREVGSWHERKSSNDVPTYYGCDDSSVLLSLSMGMTKSDSKVAKFSKLTSTNMKENSVAYGSEQTMTNLKYRFEPQYAIARRVVLEVQSLLGGTPTDVDAKKHTFQPKRVLDFGSGVGSASAAALDVFGVKRSGNDENPGTEGIDWIHSIDASQSMRDATEKVLKSVLENHPWEHEQQDSEVDAMAEEIAASERILQQIKGQVDERGKERRQRRQAKWEQTWVKQTNHRTRLTFGESIIDASSFYSNRLERDDRPSLPWQRQLDEQRKRASQKKAKPSQKGSFDLILCNYTLSELSNIPSTLTAAALLWEKLAANGVMIFVEPGTPDGFSTLRSIRSMLLECCPPHELKERRKQAQQHFSEDDDEICEDDDWDEECHVIAPCTHNAICPMSRHQRNHVKRNTRFGKYENAGPDQGGQSDEMSEQNLLENGSSDDEVLGSMSASQSEQEAALRELLGDGDDISEEDLQSMLDIIESMDDDEDDGSDGFFDEDDDEPDEIDLNGGEFYDIDQESSPSSSKSTAAQTNVFDTSFCSFVHNFPGGTSRRRGEKFSYLVVQKRIADSPERANQNATQEDDVLKQVDVVDLLAQSVHHAQKHKQEYLKNRLSKNSDSSGTKSNYYQDRSNEILQQAVELEDKFLDSANDDLGLELLHGEERRKGWGRLIRAPLKRKGHILLDYCSAGGCSNKTCSKNGSVDDGRGKIIRQKVSRAWSARVAPGSYSAARKARWGGMWPDLSERTKEVARRESMKDFNDVA